MKKRSIVLGALAALALMTVVSCATYSTVSGVNTPIGGLTSAKVNAARTGDVIAEYQIILGIITSGYEAFLEETAGKEIDIVADNYFFITKVKAVAR
jgi:hypothetical protein